MRKYNSGKIVSQFSANVVHSK